MIDFDACMACLAQSDGGQLFHSEADFQFQLAQVIKTKFPEAIIHLERPYTPKGEISNRWHLDIWIVLKDQEIAIELKYLTKSLQRTIGGIKYDLVGGNSSDFHRYAVWNDVRRLETFVEEAPNRKGYMILLSNDPIHWNGAPRAPGKQFSLSDHRTVSGKLEWPEGYVPRKKKYEQPIPLRGKYCLDWKPYYASPAQTASHQNDKILPKTGTDDFWYLLLEAS